MDREELAWAAGFFDGEGYIGCGRESHRHRGRLHIKIAQRDRQVLDRFRHSVLGLGRIYPKSGHGATKPHFSLETTTFEHAQAIIAMLWHWLSPVKREQTLRAFATLKSARPAHQGVRPT